MRRVDEEKRRHPEKTYAQIGRELGITQKDPARLIRKLRSGESSGRVIVPELIGRKPPRSGAPVPLRGRFVVAYQWWYTERPNIRYWARTNILVEHATALDIFRLRDDPRVHDAVRRDLVRKAARKSREREGSIPVGEFDYEIDGVYTEQMQRAAPVIILGRYGQTA